MSRLPIAFLLALSLTTIVSTAAQAAREDRMQCGVQLVRADTNMLEFLPRGPVDSVVQLKPNAEGFLTGELSMDFKPRADVEAPTFRVQLRLKLEKNRSNWDPEVARLYVTTRLINLQTGAILAAVDAHSDQVQTPAMGQWLRDGKGPRVLSQVLNPSLLNQLEQKAEPDLQAVLLTDIDRALQLGIARGHISRWDVYRLDTLCFVSPP